MRPCTGLPGHGRTGLSPLRSQASTPAGWEDRSLFTTDLALQLALVASGAILGALAFSLVVGRYRARQIARLTDRLARIGAPAGPAGSPKVADRVLRGSLARLANRIAEVEALATTDVMTGILNRQAGLKVLTAEVERANRYGRPLSVALIDIDHFKRVNDAHGHAAGDVLLAHVAGLLRANVRAIDSLSRYGGEEFLLIMPETTPDGGAASAEHLRRLVARSPLTLDRQTMTATISAGVAGGTGTASFDIDGLLRNADAAMYTAKALGRDQVQTFRPVDDDAGISSAKIDVGAREHASALGRAAFEAGNDQLLMALADRPGWAGGASKLIARIAQEMARAVGLPDGDVARIRVASLLHDLGKLAIPEEILHKPGSLSPGEWRTVAEHPKIGQVMLEQAGAIRDAATIVLHHHEWFDGHGYPYGLAGGEIPLGARIVAIADAYEAMIAGRPYKAAMSHAQAIAELRRNRGLQFDPDLVDVFVGLYANGLADGAAVTTAGHDTGNGTDRKPATRRRARATQQTAT